MLNAKQDVFVFFSFVIFLDPIFTRKSLHLSCILHDYTISMNYELLYSLWQFITITGYHCKIQNRNKNIGSMLTLPNPTWCEATLLDTLFL